MTEIPNSGIIAPAYRPTSSDDIIEQGFKETPPDNQRDSLHKAETSPPLLQGPPESSHEALGEKNVGTGSTNASLKDPTLVHDLPYSILSKESQENLGQHYSAGRQLRRLFLRGFLRWFNTAGLLGLLGITIWKYSTYDKMNTSDRLWFNSILIGLSIVISLAIASSLNAMVFNIRWWFLSLKKRPLCQVNAIIKSDIMDVDSYVLDPWIASFAIFWLLVNIASQIAVACFGLILSVDATDSAVFLSPGTVNIADMSHFFSMLGSAAVPSYAGEHFTANIYGNFANSTLFSDLIDTLPSSGDTYAPDYVDVFDGGDFWLYDFLEAAPDSSNWSLSELLSLVYTNRTINSTYACESYVVDPVSGDGSTNLVDIFLDGISDPSTTVTVPSVAINETTFFINNGTCGQRCGSLSVFQASFTAPQFYQCNITISETGNATLPQHLISDTFAKVAAQSIALGATSSQGYYQRYPEDSNFGVLIQDNPDAMGKQIAYFSIGALAVAYLYNPTITVPGLTPEAAYFLNIHSNSKLVLIFVLISGVQLLILLITTSIASNVIVLDGSPMAISRLLQPIVARLGSGGTVMGGKEICDVLDKEDKDVLKHKEMKVIYTAKRYDAEGVKARLVLGDGTRERAFKSGHYD